MSSRGTDGAVTTWVSSLSEYGNVGMNHLVNILYKSLLLNLPTFEENLIKYTIYLSDLLFAPKQIIRQLGMVFILQGSLLLGTTLGRLFIYIAQRTTTKGRLLHQIAGDMSRATTYDEWLKLAEQEDKLNGYDEWRREDNSPLYDSSVLHRRIADLSRMIERKQVFDLMFRLRGGLARDQHGMQHEGLFTLAKAGTKHIVERYHDTVVSALNLVCDCDDANGPIPTDAKLAFFNETRHAYGRTALLLSGGASLGFYHIGLARCLWSQGMLPRVISGASAGSLIASVLG